MITCDQGILSSIEEGHNDDQTFKDDRDDVCDPFFVNERGYVPSGPWRIEATECSVFPGEELSHEWPAPPITGRPHRHEMQSEGGMVQ